MMTDALDRLAIAAIHAIADAVGDEVSAFVEEYSDYFVLSLESSVSALRLTHYLDHPTGLVVVYAEVATFGEGADAGELLHLGFGAGPMRPAIGTASELCWRADFEPKWQGEAARVFLDEVINAAKRLMQAHEFRSPRPNQTPVAIHLAANVDDDSEGSRPPVVADESLHRWLQDEFGNIQRLNPEQWYFETASARERAITISVYLTSERLMFVTDSWGETEISAALLEGALIRNYHLRFFKLALDELGRGRFVLELPRRISEAQLRYLVRRFPGYLRDIERRLPGFLNSAM
jgi:hypothetical protein